MISRIYTIALFFLLLACSQQESSKETSNSDAVVSQTISASEFQSKISATKDPIVLDVRTPGEYASGYIEGAINLDFREADFSKKIDELDKEATYFVYCGSGRRSRGAMDLMKELKFKNVYDLEGGISQWRASDFPIKQP